MDPTQPAPAADTGPVSPLSFLVGVWRGRGRGQYPTIEPFEYEEEITFSATGKPFLSYSQFSWDRDGKPLHTETGYWRASPAGAVEAVIAQPTGFAEVDEGSVSGLRVEVLSKVVGRTSTAKEVSSIRRILSLRDDVLEHVLDMEAVGEPAQNHLTSQLRRA